ncbi:MAG: hypothetical protein ABJB01_04810 [Rudaea sp.]
MRGEGNCKNEAVDYDVDKISARHLLDVRSAVKAVLFTTLVFAVGESNARGRDHDPLDAATTEVPFFADVSAAHRRATELVDCVQLDTAKKDAEFRLSWTTQRMSVRDLERHERVLEGLKAMIEKLEAEQACAGLTVEEANSHVYPTLLAAANLGDASAAACYASAVAPLPKGQNSREDIQAFRTNANAFVKNGIDNGDWRFVEIMTQATGKLGHRYDWFGHLEPPTREQGYRYRKLLRLAATGNLANDLDDELSLLGAHLSPEVVQAMNRQAQNDFDAHFRNSRRLTERPRACEVDAGGF